MLGIRAADPTPPKQIGLVPTGVHAAGVVERLAHLHAASKQIVAGGLDVGDDQVQSLGAAGRRRGEVLAEDHRGAGARRRELDHAVVVAGGEVSVEPPTQAVVKALSAIDVRNWDDDDLELHVDRPCRTHSGSPWLSYTVLTARGARPAVCSS